MKIESIPMNPNAQCSLCAHRSPARLSSTRTGSALLIVIGTLALISVFAVVYLAIGRTDRRTANSLRALNELKDTSTTIGDFISSEIAQDRLDALVQWNGIDANVPFARREITDAPYTDWTRRSEVDTGFESDLFTPSGRIESLTGLSLARDRSVASDPWLASTTPVYLGIPGVDNADRPFSTYELNNDAHPNAKNFMDNRDWLQISNFAPDGRFVNLFNLRPNVAFNGNSFGSFDAEPGTGVVIDSNGERYRRMSEYLSLWKKELVDDPESKIQAFDPVADNWNWFPGQDQASPVTGVISSSELLITPAVWTMYQRYMFMPINQPFETLNRNGISSTWADPDFPVYQYADADGDGMADARWFELTAARDANRGGAGVTEPREDIEVLYNNDKYRYFIAARAVDLSSMVNVNTATDSLVPPSFISGSPDSYFPLGLTPAEVDLRRLLTMQDAAHNYTGFDVHQPLSLAWTHRPYLRAADGEPNYGTQAPDPQIEFVRNVTDYWNYQQLGIDGRELIDTASSLLIGRYAYDALRQGIKLGGSLTDDFRGPASVVSTSGQALFEYERNPNTGTGMITAKQREERYRSASLLDPSNLGVAWSRDSIYGSGLYGLDDLTELLTYHGINDPQYTSRLERVTTGRYESPAIGGDLDAMQTRRFGPLMSNRPLELDRDLHGITLTDIFRNPSTRPNIDNPNYREVNGRISFNSMAHFAMTPRSKLTMISGSVPLVYSEALEDPSEAIGLNQASTPVALKAAMSSSSSLFGLYSSALAGEMNTPNGTNAPFIQDTAYWPNDVDVFQEHIASTLFYGHRGPELALRIAAHSAVNMKDIADNDGDPSIATLIVDNNIRTAEWNSSDFTDPDDDSYKLYPGIAQGNLFDPNTDPTVDFLLSSNLPANRQAINVYGIEAMPILTEVSVLYAYTDASDQNGATGDADYDETGLSDPVLRLGQLIYPTDFIDQIGKVTIDGRQALDNDDYLIQVLAFQLHNPYDKTISLGGNSFGPGEALTRHRKFDDDEAIDPASNYQFDYYIEFAGRFYKIARYLEWYPTRGHVDGLRYTQLDDPAANEAFNIPNNPFLDIDTSFDPNNPQPSGGRMIPGTAVSGDNAGDFSDQGFHSDFISRNVTLAPKETRVFYVIADKRFDYDDATPADPLFNADGKNPDDRWTRTMKGWNTLRRAFQSPLVGDNDRDHDTYPDGFDGRGWTGLAEEWVNHQFGIRGTSLNPVMMMEFDPRDGKLVNETVQASGLMEDPTAVAGTPILGHVSRNNEFEVRLWKKIVTLGEESTDTTLTNNEPRNLVENDMLVDRMTLTEELTMTLNSGGGPIEIVNTFSYQEDFQDIGGEVFRNDNTGITLAQWKTQRRVDSDTLDVPAIGTITPWMLRSKSNASLTAILHENAEMPTGIDLIAEDIFDGGSLHTPGFEPTVKGDFEIQETFLEFWELAEDSGEEIIQTIALQPHLKSDVVAAGAVGAAEDDVANRSAEKFMPSPLTLTNTALDTSHPTQPQLFLNGSHIGKSPRLADLLLAWGIGPAFAPDPTRTFGVPDVGEYVAEEWMTGPEAISIALGFDEDPDTGATPGDEAISIWKDAYDGSTAVADRVPLFDDGHLAIDRFVSFVNVISEGSGVQPEFTIGPVGDILRGTGVPIALGVIDHARAIEPILQITDPIVPTAQETQNMRLSRATFGTININTAPVEVLRLLPGLSPSRVDFEGPSGQENEWWGKRLTDTNMPDLNKDTLDENPDVAAAIIAHRDRMYGVPIMASHPGPGGVVNLYHNAPLNFAPADLALYADNMRGEFPTSTPLAAGPNLRIDRSVMTGIDGIRSTPGFGSLGELLTVRIDPDFETNEAAHWDLLRHLSIQQYGFDGKASGIADGPEGKVTNSSQIFNGAVTGPVFDDYAEKISMANSVLNMLSVRSDYFAVWFVVQGYQESDVRDLRPEDPLIPSVHKRYLMVIDRTNVIEPGDKPKILVFKELPL